MFNNTTSYPLLLIQSLDATGILENLLVGDDTTAAMIARAKSYFLVFATISSCLTFAIGPRLIDTEHSPDTDDDDTIDEEEEDDRLILDPQNDAESGQASLQPDEHTRLLPPTASSRHSRGDSSSVAITFFPTKQKFTTVKRRPFYVPRLRWSDLSSRLQWWLLFFYDFLNAPLLGAVLGAIIGLSPPIHRAFFAGTYQGGIFTAWLTESFKTVGGLFVPLPLIVAGISLYTSYEESKHSEDGRHVSVPIATTVFILVVRFILWPVLSVGVIYAIIQKSGTSGILGSDPMLWVALMLMPTGAPALKIITMVQVSDASQEDEQRIAKILTISYIISPVLAFTVVGAIKACEAVI